MGQSARVVLITGVSRFHGVRLAAALSADSSIERVIGIDTVPPRDADLEQLGRTEFVRADIRNPLIAKVIASARVQTVVHAALMAGQHTLAGRSATQEMNVVGTMQLLAACQRSDTVDRLVVRSTAAVYGGGAGDPAVFSETSRRPSEVQGGFARDATEIEGFVRGLSRRRPDIAVTILRLAPVLGPTTDSALARYLAGPVVPTAIGYDPRLQLLHQDDSLEALRLATVEERPGTVNVAGEGVLMLSQAVRRAKRLRLPVPGPLLAVAGALVGNAGIADILAEDPHLLGVGRVVDTTRLREEFGFVPRHTTAQTLESFLTTHRPMPRLGLVGISVGSRVMEGRGGGSVMPEPRR